MKQDNIEFVEELCPFIEDCRQEITNRCKNLYEHCIVYQRLNVLEKNKIPNGLQRFIQRYGENYLQIGIGAKL
jgi:cellobiose phosphorylase